MVHASCHLSLCPYSPVCKIEVPERLMVSYEALVKSGLADRCVSIPVREATDAEILLVHRLEPTAPKHPPKDTQKYLENTLS